MTRPRPPNEIMLGLCSRPLRGIDEQERNSPSQVLFPEAEFRAQREKTNPMLSARLEGACVCGDDLAVY